MAQASKVSGVVQIDGMPAGRTVRAFGYNATAHTVNGAEVYLSKSLGHSTSDPDTGDYTIDLLAGYGQEIFVVAFDDYGVDFISDISVAVGKRIHPTTPNGYVFETISAGTLPTDEPTWIVDTETSQLYGTASMIARPFYRPMVHGPITPEMTGTGPIAWTPANLFTNSEAGAWYDPTDLATLYQDQEATIDASQTGDPVGAMLDKSANGITATQATASARPLNNTADGLLFDGTNDYLQGIIVDSFSNGITIAAKVRFNGTRNSQTIFSKRNGDSGNDIQLATSGSGVLSFLGWGLNTITNQHTDTLVTGTYYYIEASYNPQTGQVKIKVNDVVQTLANSGTLANTSSGFRIGDDWFANNTEMSLPKLFIINRPLTDVESAELKAWMG
jgi:hypothetical protein